MRRVPWYMHHGACLALVLAASCGPKPALVADSGGARNGDEVAVSDQERLLTLDLASPRLVEPLGDQAERARMRKFVRITVVSVVNPKRHPVTVRVDYAPSSDSSVHLGSFSLFPADNPGTFIVATQGKLRGGGAIVLSLQRPEGVAPSDTVRLALRPIEFVNQ